MKYYFVTYCNQKDGGLHTDIIDEHPLEYNKSLMRKSTYPNVVYVVWWTELTEEEYEKYK